MSRNTRIYFVSNDSKLASAVQLHLQGHGFYSQHISDITSLLGTFYTDPPDLIIFDLASDHEHCARVIRTVRSDSYFSIIPIIGIMSPVCGGSFAWEECPLDDFVTLPLNYSELFCRISLSLNRIKRIFDNNPLTRLPGNTSIQNAIDDAMGKAETVCYIDINNFKPYNDTFGFSHGDEVIRMLARIVFNAVHDSGGGFCGHVGGDDFVCIVPSERAENVAGTIITYFDHIVIDLFDEETNRLGYYRAHNRKGMEEQVPLPGISIALVPMDSPAIIHSARVSEIAAELKVMAKRGKGSRYVTYEMKG